MTLDELNDDLGLARKPFRVVAALAVNGRLPLLEHTIRRLYQKNGCYKVICSGDKPEDKELCTSLGAVWTPRRNKPLGLKWNSAFQVARDFNPDAVVFVGSSDWISDNWFSVMQPYVEAYGFAGVPGCYLTDINERIRLVNWKGYKGYRADRHDETIGVGRMLSRRLLDAIDWQPFNSLLDNSLDRSMKDNAKAAGFSDYMVHDNSLKALSLSTDLWINKHKFWMHCDNKIHYIPSERIENAEGWLQDNFPEAIELHKILKLQCELLRGTSQRA